MRIHLDTDLGGDPDDVCALAMLLGWPDVEITGITTTSDHDGLRAAYTAACLRLAGREDIPVVSGAGVSLTTLQRADPVVADKRVWPASLAPRPSPPGAALALLAASIEQGATIVAIGAYTNLALLEVLRPGSLCRVPIVVMGGWVDAPGNGLPPWGPEMDWNVQFDTRAAEIVLATAGDLTLATLPAMMRAHLHAADLPRLAASGPLGALIARQGEVWAEEQGFAALSAAHAGLPDDLVNFHWDPVTCAIALGWTGARAEEVRLRTVRDGALLRFLRDPAGTPARVVTDVDGPAFAARWLDAVIAAQREP